MQPLSGLGSLAERVSQHRFLVEGSVGNGAVDAKQILVHHTSCSDVHVPHFAVAHLTRWQADVFAVRPQCRVRNLRAHAVHIGRIRHFNRVVAVGIPEAPAV